MLSTRKPALTRLLSAPVGRLLVDAAEKQMPANAGACFFYAAITSHP